MLMRAVIVTVCLLASAGLIARTSTTESVPLRAPLQDLPYAIDKWSGVEAPRFDARVIRVLGVDEYVNRTYGAAGHRPMSLYVGFYGSQRQGDTMHSPLNCLPGSGWQPIGRARRTLQVQAASGAITQIQVNRLEIQKGADRHVMLYWYQSRGRVVASEYMSKLFTVSDAIRLNRTDGSFVRVVAPVEGSHGSVDTQIGDFVAALVPRLGRHLPL